MQIRADVLVHVSARSSCLGKKKLKLKSCKALSSNYLKKNNSNENPINIILHDELCEIPGYFINMPGLVSFVCFSSLYLGK